MMCSLSSPLLLDDDFEDADDFDIDFDEDYEFLSDDEFEVYLNDDEYDSTESDILGEDFCFDEDFDEFSFFDSEESSSKGDDIVEE